MKILHLSGEPEDVGGVLSVIRNLEAATDHLGWRHTVAVQSGFRELRQPSLNYWRSSRICSDSPSHFEMLFRAGWCFLEVKDYLDRESFDIIHAHSRGTFLTGVAIAMTRKLPVIFTNHAYSRRRVSMYRWASGIPNFHTVLLTPNMAKHYGLAVKHPQVTIISECCSDKYFEEPLAQPSHRLADGNVINLIGVGNIMRWKNWHLIAQAMSGLTPEELSRIQFSLWGPTPNDPDSLAYDRELRALVSECGLERRFLFRGMTLSVPDCLRQAHWFLLPSTNEPCSVALIEALALGVPALLPASGGNVDILQEGKTGLLFAPDDPVDLTRKLQMIAHSELPILSPNEIRESVRNRSASQVAKQYRALFDDALDRAARS